jgi:hypothetical protein
MGYFKIKNITNALGKRHPRFSTPQVIETKGLLTNEKTTVQPGHEIIIESEFLPVSAQQLRLKGFLLIQEINKNEYIKHVKAREAQILVEEASVKVLEEPAKNEEIREKSKKNTFRNKE